MMVRKSWEDLYNGDYGMIMGEWDEICIFIL